MLRLAAVVCIIAALFTPCRAQSIPLQPSPEETPQGAINFMSFSSDSQLLLTCTDNNRIQIWNSANCKLIRELVALNDDQKRTLCGVDMSPDGKQIASLQRSPHPNKERTGLLWNAENGSYEKSLQTTRQKGSAVLADFEFSPDGSSIWVSEGPSMFEWNVASGTVRAHYVMKMLHGGLRFISDTDALAVHDESHLFVFEPRTNKQLISVPGLRFRWADILNSGDRFVGITTRDAMLYGDIANPRATKRLKPLHGAAGWGSRFGENNLLVYTTSGHIERWDLKTLQCTGKLSKPVSAGNYWNNTVIQIGGAHPAFFTFYHPTPVVISPDSSLLAIQAGNQFAIVPLAWQKPG